MVREGAEGADRILIDPNQWSDDGASALAEWAVSDDGRYLAYAVQDGGTDWRTIRVLDVETGASLHDLIQRVRFSEIGWTKDGLGFFYSCFPDARGSAGDGMRVEGHAVFYHTLGTPQAKDRLVYSTPDRPHHLNLAGVTDDGRYAIVVSTPGPGANSLGVIDLARPDWEIRTLVSEAETSWTVVGNEGAKLFVQTQQGAERGKVVSIDLADAQPVFRDLVPEQDAALEAAYMFGGRLFLSYLVDARSEVRRHRLDGTLEGLLELPGIGSARVFSGRANDAEMFFVFTSNNAPTTIYRYDVAAGAMTIWAQPKVAADLHSIVVEQHFFASKDGTRVPMVVMRRADVATAPTILYGYGGFGISLSPFYSPAHVAWVEQGGIVAIANIRGGGEYGRAWHDAGRLRNKQNSFDDFIAAGEYLKEAGIASADGLVIQGESNGGLLVGAVTNQRPDLFAAALPGVGVMDMLRFDQFTGGQLWKADFGEPADEADFRTILAYSPYHNIRPGAEYPAMLVTTADTDDRVVPAHSFKYAAAIQAADLGPKPRLLRVDRRAGHGAGKPIDKAIEEVADLWAFAAHWTGLTVRSIE